MASFFRAGCVAFWMVWMCILSFYCGVLFFQRRFSYVGIHTEISALMFLACIIVTVMAFIGCCCVKCDVIHPCCVIWYTVLTSVGTLLVCLPLMVSLRSEGTRMEHEFGDVMRMIAQELHTHKRLPGFLHHTQMQYVKPQGLLGKVLGSVLILWNCLKDCCGVFGFKDYRAFFFTDKIKLDVPHSCCKNLSDAYRYRCPFKKSRGPSTALEHLFKDKPKRPLLDVRGLRPSQDGDLAKLRTELYGDASTFGPAPDRYLSPKLRLPVNITAAKLIHLEGCFYQLKKNSQTITDYYFGFSFVLIACAMILVLVFARNCLQARRETHESIEKDLLESIERHESTKVLDPELEVKTAQDVLNDLKAPKRKLRIVGPDDAKGTVLVVVPPKAL